jgi:hypothetical protein
MTFRNRVPLRQVIDDDKLDIVVVQSVNAFEAQVDADDVDVKLEIEGTELDNAKLVVTVEEK